MDSTNLEIVDFVISKDTRETLLYVSLAAAYVFLMYGIFNGRPPLLMQRDLDLNGRKYSLYLGTSCLLIFFLTLLVPVIYDVFISKDLEVYVNEKPLPEGSRLIAVSADHERIIGPISIKKKGRSSTNSVLTLPTEDPGFSVVKLPITFHGRKNTESYFQIATDDTDRIYVANESGKIRGPIKVRDAVGNVIGEMPTNNWGGIVIPENSRVEFYNAALLYRDDGGSEKRGYIGSRLDESSYTYDGHYKILSSYSEPKILTVITISDSLHKITMASGVSYNKNELIASSSLFPIGTILHISNPLVEGTYVDVVVKDKSSNILGLSSAAIEALHFTKNSRAKVEVQVKDYMYKKEKT